MKNLKNTISAIGLATILMVSATSANAGLIMSDAPAPKQCTTVKGTDFFKIAGNIINGLLMSDGLIMTDGLIMSDAPCTTKNGLIMSDGLIMTD